MPSESGALKAVIYAAKSTEDKAGSIPTQLEDCRAMAEREGWTVIGEYQDEGFSAFHGNRGPDLERAKEAVSTAARDRGAVLVVQHSDRLARGAGDAPGAADHLDEVVGSLIRQGVTLRTVQDDFYADPRMARVMAAVMGQRNTEDSARKSKAVAAGKKRRAERGGFNGGSAPYGYRLAGGLKIAKAEAEIMKRVFREFAGGRSMLAIAKGLNADKVKTRRGGPWRQSTISTILRNRVYIGEVTYKGESPREGTHASLTPPGLWTKVEQLLASRPSRGRGRPSSGHHLFRKGMLRCGHCGHAMIGRSVRNARQHEQYYCWGRSQNGPDTCSMPDLDRAKVDDTVFTYFTKVGLDMEATREALREAHDARLAEVRALVEQNKADAAKLDAEAARVERDYRAGGLPVDLYSGLTAKIKEEREAVDAKGDQLAERLAEVEDWTELKDAEQEVLERLTAIRKAIAGEVRDAGDLDAVRAALMRLFDRFTVTVEGDQVWIKPQQRATLSFNFEDEDEPVAELLSPSRAALDLNQRASSVPS